MMISETMSLLEIDDAGLVAHCLRGDRDAFAQIVARYQTLICSLAYSASGSLTQSEDLAQETFATAWRQLADLREPAKLRSWLCGILRNLSRRNRRGQQREPVHGAETLETAAEMPALEAHPLDQTISREEEAILWRSLERIPETYREPLILLYREHESVERVAQLLDLSEEAVRQRLVRGRKMLQDQVLSLVEGTLERTTPGRAFTLGVVATLPLATTSTKAATVAGTLAKGGAAAKGVITFGALGGLLAMLGGAWVSMRAQADDTKSPRERQFMNQMIGLRLIGVLVLAGVFYGIGQLGVTSSALTGDIWRAAFLFAVCLVAKIFFVYGSRRQREIQIEDKTYAADEWRLPRKTTDARAAAAGNPSTSRLMTIRFMAFGLVMSVVMSSQAPWQSDWVKSAALSAMWVLVLYVGYRGWQNRPRYLSLQANWVVLAPVVMALITLFTVNLHQYGLQGGPTPELAASTATMLIFNLAVVLAYATFMAVLVWQRRRECR